MLWQRAVLLSLGGVLLSFLLLPLLFLLGTTSLVELRAGLAHPSVWPALRLSLFTTVCTLVLTVLTGTPLAWVLSQARSRSARALETALQLPIVLPPAVAGIALLLFLGRRGPLSGLLAPQSGWGFSTAAVVLAEVFVSAPYFVQAATSAFRRVDPNLITVVRTFGASPGTVFWRVGLPLAGPGLVAGAAMSWARALGEFGATLMFAGNLEGRTQTLPLAIYTALEADLNVAQSLSVILIAVAAAVLAVVKLAQRRLVRVQEPTP